MKKILLISDGIVHPPFLARKNLHKTLDELDDYTLQHTRSLEKLPENLKDFSAIVIYIHHKIISEQALAILDDFVSSGGGILGVHSATASFKQQRHYFNILGGRFIGHGKVERFPVRSSKSEVFYDLGDFIVKDELYIHEVQPGIETHFTVIYQGEEIPAVWTYQYGDGRICYAMPGHTTATLKNKTYQKILQRGLAWVCGA